MKQSEKLDLVVVGTGPGGYIAAVRAKQLGMKVACVEKDPQAGGVCLNVGCIPSKALLDSSEYYHLAKQHFADHGIKTDKVELDLDAMMSRKQQIVKDLTGQVESLLKNNKIEIIHGAAKVKKAGLLEVALSDKSEVIELETKNILLATGSEPVSVRGLEFDGERIISSTEALSFKSVPKSLGVVGGGYIGLELGSVWQRLGSSVTVIEMLPRIASTLDGQVNRTLERVLRSQGMEFLLNAKVLKAEKTESSVKIKVRTGEKERDLTFEKLLVAVGRKPLTSGIGIENIEIETDPHSGHIMVDSTYQTKTKGVYAIGDLIHGPMLAHKASTEGIAAVECMAGMPGEVNYDAIPAVVYTWPEVACVGMTEEQIKQRGIPYRVGSYPFSGTGRARCMGEKDGFVKVIAQSKSDRILGVHIIGPRAADMIAECVLAVEFNARSEDIAKTIHGHPTFAEALQEASINVKKSSIYNT